MKSSKILAVVAMASLFAASSYAADEEIIAKYGAITIKKVKTDAGEVTVAEINDESKETPVITKDIEVDSVYFNREFTVRADIQPDNQASTLMLPFDVNESAVSWKLNLDLFEFVRVVKEEGRNNYEVHVKYKSSGHMKANTPYIALAKADNQKVSFNIQYTGQEKIVLKPTAGNHVVRHEEGNFYWDFTGTYENIVFNNPKNIFGFASTASADGKTQVGDFVKAACKDGKCASIRPFRAYLKCVPKSLNKSADEAEMPETIKVFVVDDNGKKGTTAIGMLNTRTGEFVKEDNRWFDMKGRVLDHKPTAKGTYYNNKKKVIIK
ncbi:MAG: hypothetical protein IJ908_05565 [Fibrobacter sp.]|nr:hypothetical protein [Fibrobacter sp.]